MGSELAARRVAHGDQVWGLRRRPLSLPEGVEPFEADLSVSRTLRDLPPNLDHVVYAVSPAGSDDALYRAAYVEGISRLLEALDAQGQRPQRVYYLSSTSVYAQDTGEWVDESSQTDPMHFSGKRLLEGEMCLSGCDYASTVVRLGGIYGPRRTRLLDRVRTGQAEYRKGGPFYTNRIHRDDCAGLLEHLMELESPESLYLGVDTEPVEELTVLRWLAGALGVAEPRPMASRPAKGARPRSNKRVASKRLQESGYEFEYPTFREGYSELIRDQNLA